MQSFMVLVHEIAVECEANVLDSELWLAFLRSGYLLGGYIPRLRDADLEKGSIRRPEEYTRRLQRVCATDRFSTARERRNNFNLVPRGGGEEDRF